MKDSMKKPNNGRASLPQEHKDKLEKMAPVGGGKYSHSEMGNSEELYQSTVKLADYAKKHRSNHS